MYKKRLKDWGLRKYKAASRNYPYRQPESSNVPSKAKVVSSPPGGISHVAPFQFVVVSTFAEEDAKISRNRNIQAFEFRSFDMSSHFARSAFVYPTISGSVDMLILLTAVKESYLTLCETEKLPSPFAAAADLFWKYLQDAIYLFRINSTARALTALDAARQFASHAVMAPDVCTTVREILSTLSPVNTRGCPAIRRQIIRLLKDEAAVSMGISHPISLVLCQIEHDNSTRQISERCLSLLVDLACFGTVPGVCDVAINAQLSVSRLLRKDGEHEMALAVAAHAYDLALINFGSLSVQACKALRRQQHVHIDKGRYDEALNICFQIIDLWNSGAVNKLELRLSGVTDCILSTGEDVAYIYEKTGDMTSRSNWLSWTLALARECWGDCAGTDHITDKIEGFMTQPLVT